LYDTAKNPCLASRVVLYRSLSVGGLKKKYWRLLQFSSMAGAKANDDKRKVVILTDLAPWRNLTACSGIIGKGFQMFFLSKKGDVEKTNNIWNPLLSFSREQTMVLQSSCYIIR
jgi:hypothetical protein